MVTAGSVSLWSRNNAYKAQEAELQAQIEAEETRSEEIKEYEAYVQTDEYIRETAEDKLHLADPDGDYFQADQVDRHKRVSYIERYKR